MGHIQVKYTFSLWIFSVFADSSYLCVFCYICTWAEWKQQANGGVKKYEQVQKPEYDWTHHQVNYIENMHHQVKVSGNVPETVPEECATTCSLGLLMVLMKTLMMTMKVQNTQQHLSCSLSQSPRGAGKDCKLPTFHIAVCRWFERNERRKQRKLRFNF